MAIKRLPDNPDLEHYRRRAKALRKALLAADPAALARAAQFHPRSGEIQALRLADAQLVIAREHGFASWPAFAAAVRSKRLDQAATLPAAVRCERGELAIDMAPPDRAKAVALFVLAGNAGPRHGGIRQIAERFRRAGLCTVLAELLTADEAVEDAIEEQKAYDVELLTARAGLILDAVRASPALKTLPLVLLCAGTGGAAGISLAAKRPEAVNAMVSVAGRPDLAGAALARVRAPSLFVVGGEDAVAHGFTRTMIEIVPRDVASAIEVVRGVGVRFEEGPAAGRAAELALGWFEQHLTGAAGEEQAA